jgi:glycosyltransferase involved in cell wall biosynthesis
MIKNFNNRDSKYKPKISFFAASLRGGGAERAVVDLANCLSDHDYLVDLVLVTKEGPYLSDVSAEIRIIDLKHHRVTAALVPLIKYLKSDKPDLLIATMSHVNIMALLACRLACVNTRVIVREVTDSSSNHIDKVKNGIGKGRLIANAINRLYPKAEYIVAVSDGVAKSLIANYKLPVNKVRVIYDPVVTEELAVKAEEQVEHPWFQEKSEPIILSAGRLCKEKDYPTLLKAFSMLCRQKAIRLVILGEGIERTALENLAVTLGIEDKVSFPGFVDNPFSYMKQADVFVVSSMVEGLSQVLIQAMAVGTTVVSTNCPSGPAEVLENGKYGSLVKVGNAEAMAEAIKLALNNPANPEVSNEAVKKFSATKICEEYKNLIDLVL